jgi:hypothetical protein
MWLFCMCVQPVLASAFADALEGISGFVKQRGAAKRMLAIVKRVARQLSVNSLFCGSDFVASLNFHLCKRDERRAGIVSVPDFDAVVVKVLGPSVLPVEDARYAVCCPSRAQDRASCAPCAPPPHLVLCLVFAFETAMKTPLFGPGPLFPSCLAPVGS